MIFNRITHKQILLPHHNKNRTKLQKKSIHNIIFFIFLLFSYKFIEIRKNIIQNIATKLIMYHPQK